MTRERLAWLLALAGLVVGAWWLSVNTEWVEDDTSRGAQGEARDNPVYAFEQLLRRLGLHAEHHEALDALPPPRARLVLLSRDWELMPGRAEQLHQWVMRGGHLVLVQDEFLPTQGDNWEDTELGRWVPVDVGAGKPDERPKPAPQPASAASTAAPLETRTALASTPPLWDGTETVTACGWFNSNWKLRAKPGQNTAWALTRLNPAPSTQVLRLPVGQGTVTVLNAGSALFHNTAALRCDNALLLAAAVQAEPGATVWVYLHEKREALLPWLWHQGWIALVTGALALAAALWRAAVRFGPRLAPAPRLRRSIAEQVRGLGAYLQRHGHDALLAAQQRALHDAALRHLPRYARLPAAERASVLAGATGLPADDLATALSARHCTRAQLPQRLQLLETARRRLQRTSDERHPPP